MGRWVPLTLVAIVGLACSESSEPAVPSGGGASGIGGASSVATGTGGTVAGSASTDAAAKDEATPESGSVFSRDAADVTFDVGSIDAASPITSDASDASTPSDGPSVPCPLGALLCEDFDKYASAADLASAWRITASGATLAVDATKPFGTSGKALHVVAPAGTPTAVIVKEGAPLFPIAGNVMFGRVMMWLTQTPGGNYHWNNFQAAGTIATSMQNGKYGWGGQAGKVLAGYTVRDPAGTILMDCSKPSAMALPEKRWACVEWKFDGAANEMHYWFDGVLLADVDVIGTGTRCVNAGDIGTAWQAPTFANLSVGWQQYQVSTGALELWMDDLVVSTQRIGCPPP